MKIGDAQEEWRDIKGYEGKYRVSNFGRVQYIKPNEEWRDLKQFVHPTGCLILRLYKYGKGKSFKVHRLVAEAFLFREDGALIVNHKDENRQNNHVNNLEWCTRRYNNNYGTIKERIAKTLSKPIIATVVATGKKEYYPSTKVASEALGYSAGTINCALKGRRKTACKRMWQYAEREGGCDC